MPWYRKLQAMVSKGSFSLLAVVLGAALLGTVSLWVVERELIARTGVGLALGAAEAVGKLDAMLQERDGDIQVLAGAPRIEYRGHSSADVRTGRWRRKSPDGRTAVGAQGGPGSVWPLATDSGVRYLGVMEDITVRKKTIAHTMQSMHHGRFELRTLDEARHLAELPV